MNKNNLISIYQALLTISVKGNDVVTLSNVLNYIKNLVEQIDKEKNEQSEDKTQPNKDE